MVMTVLAEELPGDTEAGAKLAVAPVGRPVAVNETVPAKVPPVAVTTRLYCAALPPMTVCGAVLLVMVKSEVGMAVPVPVREVVWVGVAELSVTVMVAV